ncbi:MAG: pyrroloquinoline quinone-dependent dehydrogenase [Bryobacterales bacterium]|nr:pyrroloquinoline quinone-dependent dehydrogenase [Bryobacterales bacterium]
MPKLKISLFLLTTGVLAQAADKPFTTWSQYLDGADSSQYSSLKQINKSNVRQLEVAWTYPTGPGAYSFNPVVVDGVMYVLAHNNTLVALDATTGKELWTHANTGAVGTRGVSYWESKDRSDRRLFYINAGFLTAIDARTGKTIDSFGDNGRTDLRTGLDRDPPRPPQTNNPGRIFENIIITPLPAGGASYDSTPADIHAYDVVTGKLLWTFHVIPRPGEFGYDTWPPEAWKTVGGVHNWNEMTIDEKRGIAYIPLGTARYDFYGANRKGNDLFGNSLLALDVRTGKRIWHYQSVHHDLWDYDLPVAPKLLTVKHDGKNVDVVAQATKFGFLFVFDRMTGAPLWPIEERPVPQSDVPGEWSSPTQPFPTKPPPFARQSFTESDIDPFATEAEQANIRDLLKNSRNEGLFTPPSLRGSISAPGHNGGANWGMVAVDPTKGFLYVITKEHPTLDKLQLPGQGRRPPGASAGGPLGSPESAPPSVPVAAIPVTDQEFIRYNSPVNFMSQTNGLSAMGPPWSTLTAYDLNSGTIRWQVPNGGVLELEKEGHTGTGARDPRGGPVVTAGGLIFAATASDHKIRAYDENTGAVLWEYETPTGSDGVPAVYEVGGREYIAFCVAAADGLNLGGRRPNPQAPPPPNAYMVFALPKK